ncbi:MAG: polyprenyl diphosphate synthase [Oscillospiraceae bacterium]
MGLFKKHKTAGQAESVLPRHVAIIMDGNGRWAKKRGLPRTAGHAAGAETFRKIASCCRDLGVEYLTVYAFSTENWKRSPEEVDSIMSLLRKYLEEALPSMERERVRIKVFGDVSVLEPDIQELIAKAEALSEKIDSHTQANLCINYGGRDEIIHAVKKWASEDNPPELTEQVLSEYMYSAGVPDPDLIIRPSGEVRISNFLLWQSAYSEFYFTDVLWPDFDEKELKKAINAYAGRDRRFGGVKG